MTANSPIIIITEDEPQIRRLLQAVLSAQGYVIVEAETGREGLTEVARRRPDLLILDLGLPDMNGVEVIKQLREWSQLPIIILSGSHQEIDKVAALDAGADDYLTKPFGAEELLARVRVALRHVAKLKGQEEGNAVLEIGGLRVDLLNRKVTANGTEIHLTPIEYRLLSVLVKHVGKTLTHRQLMHDVWGQALVDNGHYLRIYMGQLRHKLEQDPARPRYLLTEAGVGYRLVGNNENKQSLL